MAMDTSRLTDRAQEACKRRNYEYAIDLYQQALALAPDDVTSRHELRMVETRFVQEKGISSSSAWLKGLGSVFKIMFGGSKNAEKTMIECEKFLKHDPGNVWVLTKLGMAALSMSFNKTAIEVFTGIKQAHPTNIENLRRLSEALEADDQIPESIQACEEIQKVKPGDNVAADRIKNLSAVMSTKVFDRGAREGSTAIVKDSKTHEAFELEAHEIKSIDHRNRAIAFQQERIATDTTKDPRHLATFHAAMGDMWLKVEPDFVKSEECYNAARKLQPTDFTFVFKLDDLNILKYRTKLAELQQKLKANASDAAAKAEYQKIRGEYNQFRMKSFENRVKERPMDLKVAFVLASIYFEMEKLDEAIAQYQRTVKDPANRRNSLLRLGLCFSKKGQASLAAKQFETGISEIEVMNEVKKTMLYYLGDTKEKMGQNGEALKAFTVLYEADIGFKDVEVRLTKLKGS